MSPTFLGTQGSPVTPELLPGGPDTLTDVPFRLGVWRSHSTPPVQGLPRSRAAETAELVIGAESSAHRPETAKDLGWESGALEPAPRTSLRAEGPPPGPLRTPRYRLPAPPPGSGPTPGSRATSDPSTGVPWPRPFSQRTRLPDPAPPPAEDPLGNLPPCAAELPPGSAPPRFRPQPRPTHRGPALSPPPRLGPAYRARPPRTRPWAPEASLTRPPLRLHRGRSGSGGLLLRGSAPRRPQQPLNLPAAALPGTPRCT